MAFDLLFERYSSLMTAPLAAWRAALRKVVTSAGDDSAVYSEGVVGLGREFFERVTAEGLSPPRPAAKGSVPLEQLWTQLAPERRRQAETKESRVS